jgi:hypothetical protein
MIPLFRLIISLLFFLPYSYAQDTLQLEGLFAPDNSMKDRKNYYNFAIFRGLDKINDKLTTMKLSVRNELHYYEKLQVKVLKCWKAPAYEEPEDAALVEIYEQVGPGKTKEVFKGWLFSNNAFLTNIEHQRYDLRLLSCIN